MVVRLRVWPSLILALFVCGCGHSDRLELERTRAELEMTRAELVAQHARAAKLDQESTAKSYLEELETLDTLKTKGILSSEEFDAKKKAILEQQLPASTVKPEPPVSGMDELAQQLRILASLYTNSTITLQERDAKKTQLIQRPLHVSDMKKDLETVLALYNESAITLQERDTLKQKLLELDTGPK